MQILCGVIETGTRYKAIFGVATEKSSGIRFNFKPSLERLFCSASILR